MTGSSDNLNSVGQQMHDLVARLFPIPRSQTGDGLRRTFDILQEWLPLSVTEIPSGTPVLGWEVPQEWNIHDAWIRDETGKPLVDYQQSTLHVVNGSVAVHAEMDWDTLQTHLHTVSDQPCVIPYRTAFFQNDWGFCVSQHQYDELKSRPAQRYDVCVDTTVTDGSMTLAEYLLPGESEAEVLLSTHTCHPSLANDGLSGIAVATFLAEWLAEQPRRYTYRIVFAPATIGAITWLSLNQHTLDRIRHGLVLSCIGDSGPLHYRRSRRGNSEIDRCVEAVLSADNDKNVINDFEPFGYDQRQFCSPGFDLPVGGLMRTPNGQYPEYHTSADDLSLVTPDALEHSLSTLVAICERLEAGYSETYVNLEPYGEPRLGRHGLYQGFGSRVNARELQEALLWTLNLSDGHHSLADITHRSGIPLETLREAAQLLEQHNFLQSRFTSNTSSDDSNARHVFAVEPQNTGSMS